MPRYMVLDLETETHSSYKRKANPFDSRNWIVMRGYKFQGDARAYMEHFPTRADVQPLRIPDDVDTIVAHNAKFEILYELVYSGPQLREFFKRGGRVFCTQYAEYLLRAQQQKYQMASLDSIVESYGGRKKIDGIKALWEAGVLTSQIDPALLEDYLIGTEDEGRNSGDIGNTELVYLGQIKELEENGMLAGAVLRMDGLCATAEMEFNGIKVDVARARSDLQERSRELEQVTAELQQYISGMPEGLVFNWDSNVHKSALIFGGTIKYSKQAPYIDEATGEFARRKATEKWPLFDGEPVQPNSETCALCEKTGLYYRDQIDPSTGKNKQQDTYLSGKNKGAGKFKTVDVPGEIKVKYQDFLHRLPGYTKPDPLWKMVMTDGAGAEIFGTGADIIAQISNRDIPFLRVLGRHTALSKEIGTYYVRYDEKKKAYVGMLTCVGTDDHIVHHKLNHTSTVTTRLSSESPNCQNIPRKGASTVKGMFHSRFQGGVVAELDYSQLEVVVQGLLSGDKNLVADLQSKIDFHCKRVATKYGCTYDEAVVWCKDEEASPDYQLWKGRRTGVKEFSFQR